MWFLELLIRVVFKTHLVPEMEISEVKHVWMKCFGALCQFCETWELCDVVKAT